MINKDTLELDEHLQKAWLNKPQDVFDHIQQIEGEIYKAKDNRKVMRFELDGRALFLKIHQGIGWKEAIKNLLQLKLPITGASNEWLAINYLQANGIQTMTAVGYGCRGWNPVDKLSFLVTKELANTVTLENHCREWLTQPPTFCHRLQVVNQLAGIAKKMHHIGVNHRDFYLCHFLLTPAPAPTSEHLNIFLVDLHRAQMRATVPKRWLVKDIGSLYYSALEVGVTHKDILRFIRLYSGKTLREALQKDIKFWRMVEQRAIKLYIKAHGIKPHLPQGSH